ncbi:MAG TPA: M43 family zinc metalloprotease [Bacteroidia bacterium]|jgi:PKD repeat protein
MKKLTRSLFAAFSLFLAGTGAFAQHKYCHTDEMVHRSLNAHPELKSAYLAEEERLSVLDTKAAAEGYTDQQRGPLMPPIYKIPVVFHIIHQNGPENISDAQIHDQMRILNEDFRKMNSDISAVVPAFTGTTADSEIEFELARKDPNGNCTNGIDRIFSDETNIGDESSKLNYWPRSKYLNVWVVKTITSGAAGYAYLPGTAWPTNTDGIIILSTYIGSIGTGMPQRSRALTHEIGHFLNLQHVWGNSNSPGVACGDDNVTDTPVTKGHTTCNLTDATCTPGVVENVQNFMEYSYCSNMFTPGQKTRMRAALNSGAGQRNSLWTAANLTATGISTPVVLCQADFISDNSSNTVCQGNSLTFTDASWNGNPTSWSWTFPGGTPSTSTDSVPEIQYNTPGIYDVTLSVTNASGTVSVTKPGYVTVNSNTASFTGSVYQEGFEASALPNSTWVVRNQSPGGNTWVQTGTAAATGTKSAMIGNLSTYSGYVDELIGPSIDMTAITGTSPMFTFKTAFAQRNSSNTDKLQLFVSTNCGMSWTLRKSLTGATLNSGGVVTGTYVPNATQWVEQSATLSGFVNQTNLYFMFRFTSDGGNYVYIDDINISGVTTGVEDLASFSGFNLYPNPIAENTVVELNLPEKQFVNITVTDVLGRELDVLYNDQMGEGEHLLPVGNQSKYSQGVYFIRTSLNGKSFTKKMIVQ